MIHQLEENLKQLSMCPSVATVPDPTFQLFKAFQRPSKCKVGDTEANWMISIRFQQKVPSFLNMAVSSPSRISLRCKGNSTSTSSNWIVMDHGSVRNLRKVFPLRSCTKSGPLSDQKLGNSLTICRKGQQNHWVVSFLKNQLGGWSNFKTLPESFK